MIFSLISIALVVVLIVCLATRRPDNGVAYGFMLGGGFFGLIGVVACSMFISSANIRLDADIANAQEKRKTLVYQLENHTYENDNNLGTVELMNEVAKFNGSIMEKRELRKNPWTSWCISRYCEYIEPIDINEYDE